MKSLTYDQEVEAEVKAEVKIYGCPIWGSEYVSRKGSGGQYWFWHSFRAGGMFASYAPRSAAFVDLRDQWH